MARTILSIWVGLSISIALISATAGQSFDERFTDWPVDLKINGRMLIFGGTITAQNAVEFLKDEREPEVYVLAIGSELGGRAKEIIDQIDSVAKPVGSQIHKPNEKIVLPSDDWKGDVLLVLGDQSAYSQERFLDFQPALKKWLDRGGELWIDGSLTRLIGSSSDGQAKGLDLVPDAMIVVEESSKVLNDNLIEQLQSAPRKVGLRLSPDTVLGFRGRKMMVRKGGAATVLIPGNQHLESKTQTLEPVEGRRFSVDNLLDWTQWRRESIERTLEPFPPSEPDVPDVKHGTLIIIGGGGMPKGLMDRFVKIGGGKDAELVYVPCSEQDEVETPGILKAWEQIGVAKASFIHTKDRLRADKDQTFFAPLQSATGLMFGGGRQWNFSDSYYGTHSHQLMKMVLERGGVVMGSSAGASIQARYLARATPIGNTSIMAPGYERGGLGFISGVAIDQHFSQRRRQADMTQLVQTYPQLLGIGIDETTAIVVTRSRAEVVGRGKVYFYDRKQPVVEGKPDYIALPAGSVYDLAERKVLVDSREKEKGDSETGGQTDSESGKTKR